MFTVGRAEPRVRLRACAFMCVRDTAAVWESQHTSRAHVSGGLHGISQAGLRGCERVHMGLCLSEFKAAAALSFSRCQPFLIFKRRSYFVRFEAVNAKIDLKGFTEPMSWTEPA